MVAGEKGTREENEHRDDVDEKNRELDGPQCIEKRVKVGLVYRFVRYLSKEQHGKIHCRK